MQLHLILSNIQTLLEEVQTTVVTWMMMTYLFVVRVADNQKGVVWPRQDIFTCVVPGYRVDLQRDKTQTFTQQIIFGLKGLLDESITITINNDFDIRFMKSFIKTKMLKKPSQMWQFDVLMDKNRWFKTCYGYKTRGSSSEGSQESKGSWDDYQGRK